MPLNTIQLFKVKNVRVEYIKLIGKVIEIKTFRWKTNIRKLTFENRHDKISFIIFSLCHCYVCILSKIFQNIHC